ncbi:hypothetical protein ACIQU6_19985 [Streptomyces sp. NPDC090442]|uniref:hypothetical protein n=1 Tax=Streptomyces sp. NPDC090442 TaxID=3365962 RepID=UPI0037F44FED
MADHIPDRLGATRTSSAVPSARLMLQVIEAFDQYARECRAANTGAGDGAEEGDDPLRHVRWIADTYERRRGDPELLQAHLEELANELDLHDVWALRVAGEAVVAATPVVILHAARRGMRAPAIAEAIGLAPARVYDVLSRYVRYTWRIDVQDAPDQWWPIDEGEQVAERRFVKESDVAHRAARIGTAKADGRSMRVLVWQGPQSDDADASYTHTVNNAQGR